MKALLVESDAAISRSEDIQEEKNSWSIEGNQENRRKN